MGWGPGTKVSSPGVTSSPGLRSPPQSPKVKPCAPLTSCPEDSCTSKQTLAGWGVLASLDSGRSQACFLQGRDEWEGHARA